MQVVEWAGHGLRLLSLHFGIYGSLVLKEGLLKTAAKKWAATSDGG